VTWDNNNIADRISVVPMLRTPLRIDMFMIYILGRLSSLLLRLVFFHNHHGSQQLNCNHQTNRLHLFPRPMPPSATPFARPHFALPLASELVDDAPVLLALTYSPSTYRALLVNVWRLLLRTYFSSRRRSSRRARSFARMFILVMFKLVVE